MGKIRNKSFRFVVPVKTLFKIRRRKVAPKKKRDYDSRTIAGLYKYYNDHLIYCESGRLRATHVYKRYVIWCKKMNLIAVTNVKFFYTSKFFLQKKRVNGGTIYQAQFIK